jgi:uncharacterized protein YgbK (DUF1537 family)
MRVVQTIGVPADGVAPQAAGALMDADAVVVALKSRTNPAAEAVAQSLAAARWLRAQGAQQLYFKVCSTFDSTARGNIGPVLEALMDELGASFSIATPAFPDNGRTVFKGHLFVGDVLLSDSGMRHHPLTPMTDANLLRVLQAQLDPARARRVGLIDHKAVGASADAVRQRIAALQSEGMQLAIADAVGNDDLLRLGAAVKDLPVVCAGSGLAIGLPHNWGITPSADAARLPAAQGKRLIVSGSCSQATNAQVARFLADGGAARALDPLALAAQPERLDQSLAERVAELGRWARDQWQARPGAPLLVYSTAEPSAVKAVQERLGVDAAGSLVERALAAVTRHLVAQEGVGQLVVAGGETSGACVLALDIAQLRIGAQIDPGVPWCHAASPAAPGGLHIALKSGNFGGPDFFTRAFQCLA